jgi:dolichyl-phosphate-mannose--protein O-mannosyl transferase
MEPKNHSLVQEDVNSHWTIKGHTEKNWCKRGEPVECGQKIRLEHLTTHRNLHSHHFSSPLSNSQVPACR